MDRIEMQNLKRPKLEEAANWSKLCRDVLQMVLERLSPTDFDRAKAVCSAWRSASKQSVRKQNRVPWLILFPYERSYGYSCRMLNPAEESLVYTSRPLGVEFTQSRCIATCGSWLLMYLRQRPKLYILNPLTLERINLPPLESRKNDIIISDPSLCRDDLPSRRQSALMEEIEDLSTEEKLVLWVDERSKDYLVVWSHRQCCLFFSKKGDTFWRMFPYLRNGCRDLVYRGHKLYICSRSYLTEIYDFSKDSPLEITRCPYDGVFHISMPDTFTRRIAVTTSGEVLMVRLRWYEFRSSSFHFFYVYKMNDATTTWDLMASLGDQALILDLGITVSAKDIQGLKANSIYFSGPGFGTNHIFIFDLATGKVERLEPFMSLSRNFFDARWFIPNV